MFLYKISLYTYLQWLNKKREICPKISLECGLKLFWKGLKRSDTCRCPDGWHRFATWSISQTFSLRHLIIPLPLTQPGPPQREGKDRQKDIKSKKQITILTLKIKFCVLFKTWTVRGQEAAGQMELCGPTYALTHSIATRTECNKV